MKGTCPSGVSTAHVSAMLSLLDGDIPQHGRRLRSPAAELTVEQTRESHQLVPGEAVLGEKIGRILLTLDFSQVDPPGSHSVLDPKDVRVMVPEFS